MRAERIAGLAGRDDEQTVIQIGEIIHGAKRRAMNRFVAAARRHAAIDRVSPPGLSMRNTPHRLITGRRLRNGWANTA